eukprot:1161696-Pelagomonas_calceolata.AAC.32
MASPNASRAEQWQQTGCQQGACNQSMHTLHNAEGALGGPDGCNHLGSHGMQDASVVNAKLGKVHCGTYLPKHVKGLQKA